MKEAYRIKKGNLSIKSLNISFDFGLIFEEDGIFYFDFYVEENFDLLSFMEREEKIYLHNSFSMIAKTDKNNDLEATQLSVIGITPQQSLLQMQSFGHLKHTEIRENNNSCADEEKEDKKQVLFFLEIEGLKMQFTDITEISKTRGGIKINEFNDWKRDHTSALLFYDSTTIYFGNYFRFTFYPCEIGNNILVELPNYRNRDSNILYYDIYKEFKRELIFILSLLNGAEVSVRKEYLGGYYIINKVKSETIINYSYNTTKNERFNKYVPINNPFYRGVNILGHALMHCFNRYISENKKLDLNSIIFYLNGAEQARSIEEKFFILIIAFERLAQKYIELIENSDSYILDDNTYNPIKDELLSVLNKHSRSKIKIAIGKLKAKIGDLNKVKRTSTEYKFNKLLEYANIDITPEIQVIINEARHKSIHQGEIDQGNDGIKNYLVLDELLRDIILNIIGYNSVRISSYRFNPEKGQT